jgi:hypothetical protein
VAPVALSAAGVLVRLHDQEWFGFFLGDSLNAIVRGAVTMNTGKLTPDAFQVLMQDKDNQTTQRSANMACRPAVELLLEPNVTNKLS